MLGYKKGRALVVLLFFLFHAAAITYCNLVPKFKLEQDGNVFDKYLNTVGAAQRWRMFNSIPWMSTHEVSYLKSGTMHAIKDVPLRVHVGLLFMFNEAKFTHMPKVWAKNECIEAFYRTYTKTTDPLKKQISAYNRGVKCDD